MASCVIPSPCIDVEAALGRRRRSPLAPPGRPLLRDRHSRCRQGARPHRRAMVRLAGLAPQSDRRSQAMAGATRTSWRVTAGHVRPRPARKTAQQQLGHGEPWHATACRVRHRKKAKEGSETEPAMARYVEQLEKRIDEKDDVIDLLKGPARRQGRADRRALHALPRDATRCLVPCSACWRRS